MKILLVVASAGSDVGGMERQVALQAKHLNTYKDIQLCVAAAASYEDLFNKEILFFPISAHKNRATLTYYGRSAK
mgnify:CR=1 FL=1